MNHRARLTQSVTTLRQAAICCSSAVDSMTRAAARSNPEKQLRCWTAEQHAKLVQKLAQKGAGK